MPRSGANFENQVAFELILTIFSAVFPHRPRQARARLETMQTASQRDGEARDTRVTHASITRPRPATGRSHPTATKPAHDHASAARERRARAATAPRCTGAPTTVHPSTSSLRPSAPTSVSSRAPRVTPALYVYSTKCLRRSTHAWPQETDVRSVAAEAPRGNTSHDDTRSVIP